MDNTWPADIIKWLGLKWSELRLLLGLTMSFPEVGTPTWCLTDSVGVHLSSYFRNYSKRRKYQRTGGKLLTAFTHPFNLKLMGQVLFGHTLRNHRLTSYNAKIISGRARLEILYGFYFSQRLLNSLFSLWAVINACQYPWLSHGQPYLKFCLSPVTPYRNSKDPASNRYVQREFTIIRKKV